MFFCQDYRDLKTFKVVSITRPPISFESSQKSNIYLAKTSLWWALKVENNVTKFIGVEIEAFLRLVYFNATEASRVAWDTVYKDDRIRQT